MVLLKLSDQTLRVECKFINIHLQQWRLPASPGPSRLCRSCGPRCLAGGFETSHLAAGCPQKTPAEYWLGALLPPVTDSEGWLGHVIEIQGDLGKNMPTAALRGSFWSTFQNIMARLGLRWDAWIPYLFIGMRHTSVGIVVVGCGHKRSLESVVSGLKEEKKESRDEFQKF